MLVDRNHHACSPPTKAAHWAPRMASGGCDASYPQVTSRARAILCHLSLLTPRRAVEHASARSFSALKAVRSAPGAEATVEAAGGHVRRRDDWADHGSDLLRAI